MPEATDTQVNKTIYERKQRMNIIIPMAGIGSRMRPHTLTVPKPLLHVAGKPIVQRLVEDIAKVVSEPLNEIAFIIGPNEQFFGKEIQAFKNCLYYFYGRYNSFSNSFCNSF